VYLFVSDFPLLQIFLFVFLKLDYRFGWFGLTGLGWEKMGSI
jgi:hypothetical protein